MFHRYCLFLIGLAACGGTVSAQPKPVPSPTIGPPVIAPPPTVRPPVGAPPAPKPPLGNAHRRFPLAIDAEAWPAPMALRALPSSPDWVGDDAYPPDARERELEGQVTFEALVGADGVPKACRIVVPSAHVELDDGTCARAMTMRFEPPRNDSGEPVEASYRARLTWLMSDPTAFGPALLTAELRLSDGQVSDCRLSRTGAVPREWMRFACLALTGERAHFLGEHLASARRATVLVELRPAGAAPIGGAEATGRLIARRRTSFEVNRDGEISDCRTIIDEGFARRMLDYSGDCGMFLTQAWIERGAGEDAPRDGWIEIRVHVER